MQPHPHPTTPVQFQHIEYRTRPVSLLALADLANWLTELAHILDMFLYISRTHIWIVLFSDGPQLGPVLPPEPATVS